MTHRTSQVRAIRMCSRTEVSGKLAASWARISAGHKGDFADKLDISTKTIDRALIGETLPGLDTALNSLAFDVTALDEVFALYGLSIKPLIAAPSNDLTTISSLSNLVGQFAAALSDGQRDHRETLQLADMIRPVMAMLSAICAEADAVRAA